MAQSRAHQLSVLGTAISYEYVCHSLQRHSLTERPRLSSLLILLATGSICLFVSYLWKWLPGADGPFNSNSRPGRTGLLASTDAGSVASDSDSKLPARPKRFSVPILIVCIVVRLEISNYVNYKQQCSALGIEASLCVVIACYNALSWRGNWSTPASEESEDPWRTVFDDIRDWLTGPRAEHSLSIASAAIVSIGTYVASNQVMRSTFFCFAPVDSRSQVVLLQCIGLLLDAAIIINLWRILAWTRNFKLRLYTLSNIFLISSISIAFVWIAINVTAGNRRFNIAFGRLYAIDVFVDSCAFALLAISAAYWTCGSSPTISSVSMTSFVGIWRASSNVFSLGDWTNLSRAASLLPLLLVGLGFGIFVYVNEIRYVMFVRRLLFVFVLVALLITCTIFTFVHPLSHFEKRHPLNDLIYEARAVHDRWLVEAATSRSIDTAVAIYEERHGGRKPPPRFSEWYHFAAGSAIMDDFRQIDKDLDTFWSLSPATLRKRVRLVISHSGVGTITIKDGEVTASDFGNDANSLELNELVDMVKKFSTHLPDMIIPVNLRHGPRVLPPWADRRLRSKAYLRSMAKSISTRSESGTNADVDTKVQEETDQDVHGRGWHQTWASDFRHMYSEACPSSSLVRTSPHWDVASFCSACVKPHSRGQFIDKWSKSLETCDQPDLNYLHGFFLTNPSMPPIQELVPLFGSFKTAGFSDILLPLAHTRADDSGGEEPFLKKKNTFFWRSSIGAHAINEQALRGGHKTRLLHLMRDPNIGEQVTMVLPSSDSEGTFKSESALVTEVNHDLSFEIGVGDYDSCMGSSCGHIKQAYGEQSGDDDPLHYRYILLTDEDDGPPTGLLKILQSQSVPLISTIFQSWYSDRLTPWLHFVPLDVRYQALHTTMLYFAGTENRAKMNGINKYLKGRPNDAEWVAKQGQRWASKVLQKKDREIYLFRLLLEWGRLIDDKRDDIGYRKDINGEYASDDWSRPT